MQNTTYTVGFTDTNTIQLRFELGDVDDSAQTTDVPDGLSPDDDGYVYDSSVPGGWRGRITGENGQYWQTFDTYNASPIDPLFDVLDGDTRAAIVDDPTKWTVSVNGAAVDVTGLSRKANILETAETSLFSFEFRTAQHVFLDLGIDLNEGDDIQISFEDPSFEAITATFDTATTISEAVHVNLTGYDPDDLVKKAYLSSWNGWEVDASTPDGGTRIAQDYDPGMTFSVIDANSGAVVKTGDITLAQAVEDPNNFWNNFNGTDVWEMDFSDITTAGDYYVAVDGVGISQSFTIEDSHWNDIFDVSFSGFYHQRSGISLDAEHTDLVRPASLVPGDDLQVLRTTVKISETSEGSPDGSGGKPFDRFPDEITGETVDAYGGWHDAGDWDRRTQHLEAARNLMELAEMTGDWGKADDLNIPERGDGIPDILQEAMWGIEVFKRLQTDDGGIPGGIEQESYDGFGGSSWAEGPVIYAYAPDVWSSWEYAAAASKLAHNLAPYDADLAQEWLDTAIDAMAYAEANWQAELGDSPHPRDINARNIAALEMYRATGNTDYHDVFVETSSYADGTLDAVTWQTHQYEAAFLYAQMGDMALNDTIKDTGLADMQGEIDLLIDIGSRSGFGSLYNPYAPYGWGNTATQPNLTQDVFVRMHHLTGDPDLLKAIQGDVQYTLGANPLNMVYMTGLGDMRGPEEILNIDAETLGYTPPPGITVYGDFHIHDYGWGFYHDIMYADQWPNVWQAPVSESWQGFSVYVPVTEYTVQQGITDMTYVTGYLAALGTDSAPVVDGIVGVGTDEGDTLTGSKRNDMIDGAGGDDAIQGRAGDDQLFGGAGGDMVIGGGGADTLGGGTGDDTLRGRDGDDVLLGDSALGSLDSPDTTGAAGNDKLIGDAGNDTLDGGAGNDELTGGSGADVFVFGLGYGTDRVRDFDGAEDALHFAVGLEEVDENITQFLADHATLTGTARAVVFNFEDGDKLVIKSKSDISMDMIEDALTFI